MNLLSEGVGVHHVNNVVEHVSNLCGKTVDRLPTTTTINRISDQRGSVAHMHIKDKLIEEIVDPLRALLSIPVMTAYTVSAMRHHRDEYIYIYIENLNVQQVVYFCLVAERWTIHRLYVSMQAQGSLPANAMHGVIN